MKKILTVVFAVLLVLHTINLVQTYTTFFVAEARECAVDCDCTDTGDPNNPDPDCAPGVLCRADGCTRPPPPNVCCVPGSGESVCQGERIWTYFHDAECLVDWTVGFYTNCSYHWEPVRCPVTDSCMGQTGLRPGKCTSDGCRCA